MILDDLADYARVRVVQAKCIKPLDQLQAEARALIYRERRNETIASIPRFSDALASEQLSFICEIKRASPSKGLIDPEFPYVDIAREYERAGAECISCLTEPKWFLGSDEIFADVRGVQRRPMIRKDFTVDPYQVYEAKVMGAQAVLLICSLLDTHQLESYLALCDELGLDALVEAHDANEIASAVTAGARIIGVNNRNLKDFTVDFENAQRLRDLIPSGVLYVAESGVKTADDVAQVAVLGADAVLVGEALMRASDKGALLAEFRRAAQAGAARTKVAQPSAQSQVALKFCGLSQVDDVGAINEIKPDYVGLVFWPASKRAVNASEARALCDLLDPFITRVGVFVDEDIETIASYAEAGIIQVAQLHGVEDEAYIERLRCRVPQLEIWQAFVVQELHDVVRAQHSAADRVLVDGGKGNGEAFEWNLLRNLQRPFILAGGLTCENVAEAMRVTNPAAVDVSSGIECDTRAPDGRTRKDPQKMRAFVQAVHHASR